MFHSVRRTTIRIARPRPRPLPEPDPSWWHEPLEAKDAAAFLKMGVNEFRREVRAERIPVDGYVGKRSPRYTRASLTQWMRGNGGNQ